MDVQSHYGDVLTRQFFLICNSRLNTKIHSYSSLLRPVCLLSCISQGIKHTDHFGFICRHQSESGPSQYVCYVFQCASESLVSPTNSQKCKSAKHLRSLYVHPTLSCAFQVDEVMLTLKQAFTTAAALQSNKTQIQLCEACPMHDLHKLCERIEGKSRGLSQTSSTSPRFDSWVYWCTLCFSELKRVKECSYFLVSVSRSLPT